MGKAAVELIPVGGSIRRNSFRTVMLIDGKQVAEFGFVEQVNETEITQFGGMVHERLVKSGPMPEPDPLAVECARRYNETRKATQ